MKTWDTISEPSNKESSTQRRQRSFSTMRKATKPRVRNSCRLAPSWLSIATATLAWMEISGTLIRTVAGQQAFPPPPFATSPVGPIDEAMVTCNMEELEQANDSQLYTILHDLKETTFFRTFRVDLSHKCPLRLWNGDSDDDEDGEDEFECPSSQHDDTSSVGNEFGLDEGAEPLCTVTPEEGLGNGDENDVPGFLASNALHSLSQDGFQSKEQRETFSWKQHSDKVEADAGDVVTAPPVDTDCDPEIDHPHLPEDFWVDLCTRVRNDDPSVVNLGINPERNTGYNGTHIWTAIYEENCRAVSPSADEDVCLEERVLYRLLSGLHASTTLSIAKNFYPPSKRKGRADWEANPTFFMEKFSPHPEYVRNLHFSYVVLLRALAKASSFLHHYEIRTGDVVEDETATVLLRRLLDSSILQSCSSVFSAFDESLMFAPTSLDAATDFSLQHSFKDVFFNVSSILDCVQCQQCKLHGKMAMLGYGTALKILFSPSAAISSTTLTRNEIVAFLNTLAKFSESIRHVRELTAMYVEAEKQQEKQQKGSEETETRPMMSPLPSSPPTTVTHEDSAILSVAAVDVAVGAIASLARQGLIDAQREAELIELALQRNPDLLVLARHYATLDPVKFLQLAAYVSASPTTKDGNPDAIVIGSGLAGMAAALNILDRGGKVVLLEKEHLLGGNSNKASSGINACCPDDDPNATVAPTVDSIDVFRNDTERSAGASVRKDLIDVLVRNSASAVSWLRERVGVDLSLKAQLGGHSAKRTHRPSNGMAGAEIIYGVQKAVKKYQSSGKVKILTDSKVTELIQREGCVVGVKYISLWEGESTKELYADNVVLATGGFAADRSTGSYLSQYRPELLKMPATAGEFSTGDGITLATALGAGHVDMDKVQVHPTGWVDPKEPEKLSKILAAELMRGVGGVLLNGKGERFCNELGTRAYVTDKMLAHNSDYATNGEWNVDAPIPTFSLILSSSAALDGKKHVDLYTHKGLLKRIEGVTALAEWMKMPESTVLKTFKKYQVSAESGKDEFGKTSFRGVPQENLETETFYAGTVTPVLHYCMGGITIDTEGNVLSEDGEKIPGLYAAGEVTGGVHGANRLGGNSLLECTVFGSLVGKKIPVSSSAEAALPASWEEKPSSDSPPPKERTVTRSELAQHSTPEDCWVAIHGTVYDLTSFAEEHPAGPESIHVLAGKDGSEAFEAVHNTNILEEVFEDVIGKLVDDKERSVDAESPSDQNAEESCSACSVVDKEAEEKDCSACSVLAEDPTELFPQQGTDEKEDSKENSGEEMTGEETAKPSSSFFSWRKLS